MQLGPGLGVNPEAEYDADATAALGFVGRRGLGNCRHLDTQSPWIQAAAAGNAIRHSKASGAHKPADVCTNMSNRREWRTIY